MTFNLLTLNLYDDLMGFGIFTFKNHDDNGSNITRCLLGLEINETSFGGLTFYFSILFFNFEF